MTDSDIQKFLENKINTTTGEEQQKWANKFDIFTNRSIFVKYNKFEMKREVEKIRQEVQSYAQ